MIAEYRGQLPVKRLAALCGTVRTSYYRRLQGPFASVQRRDGVERVGHMSPTHESDTNAAPLEILDFARTHLV